MTLLLATVATIRTQSAHAHGHHGHHGVHVSAMSATGIPRALATHSTAFLYGFGLGKSAGLRGYYDVMNECSNRPCDSGYNHGWNKYCHIGLSKHPDAAAVCREISGPKIETESPQF